MDKVIFKQNLRKISQRERMKSMGLTLDKKRKVKWIGNDYGGFAIDDSLLRNSPVVFSFGIGEDISFDIGLMENYNANIYGFDPTPKSIQWVENNVRNSQFHFYPYGLGTFNGVEKFYLPENSDYVSGSIIQRSGLKNAYIEVPMKTFNTILSDTKPSRIDILKMDIEGSEFKVISDILNSKIMISQICVEVHSSFFENGDEMLKKFLKECRNCGYELIYVSDSLNELTFIYGGSV